MSTIERFLESWKGAAVQSLLFVVCGAAAYFSDGEVTSAVVFLCCSVMMATVAVSLWKSKASRHLS